MMMKTIKIHFKIIDFLISTMILLQGCTVYKSTTASLEEVSKSQTKAKVLTTNNETLKFKRIDFIDGKYLGVISDDMEINPKIGFMPLDENNIQSIKVKDKTTSLIINIGIPIVLLGGILWIAADSVSPTFGGI